MPAATVQAPSPAVKNRTTTPTPSSQPSTRAFQGITPSIGKQAASATSWAQSALPALRLSGGQPLNAPLRRRLEKSFRADLGGVRVHNDAYAAMKADQLGAKAFAIGPNIVLGSGASADDVGLMAHEAAHTLQQRSGGPLQRFTSGRTGDAHEHEAQRASAAAVRGESFTVQQQTSPRMQGLFGIDISLPNPLNWLADKANIIPGFRMFTIVLGVNPINMSPVARSAANILRALIEFLPGGGLITQALDNSGVFEKAGAFVEKQIASLGLAGASIKAAVTAFISGLSLPGDLLHPDATWERAKRIFTDPIDRIKSFGIGLVTGIVQIVKDAILRPIAKLAEGTEGYALLKAVMGKDPITGDPVPQTAEAIIGPFMKLIGQEEIWENMKKANAIPRAFAWFKGALSGLMGFVSQIPDLFIAAFKALELADIILVPLAFGKLVKVFGSFLGKFVSWAGDTIWNLLEIIFDVVSPGAFSYVKKTGAALKSILKNPLPFVGNLVRAAKLGFTNFADRFGTHLKAGLINWLMGSLPGVYIPQAFSLLEFGKFALSVFGISWAQIRGKIVKALGSNGETIMQGLETAFDVVKALVTGGPAAAWEVIKEKLANLKEMIIDGIVGFIKDTVVQKAIPKLIAMFIPGAGFISAIISIYDTVMVFVQKIATIIEVVKGFVDSIVAIAGGAIDAAAGKVERILAGLLSLAISFLAGFVGLGKVADKIMGVINKVRDKVDKALDAAIAWIVDKAKKLFAKAKGAVTKWWKASKPVEGTTGEKHTLLMQGEGANAKLIIKSDPTPYRVFVNGLKTQKDKNPALKIADQLDKAIAAAAKASAPANAGEIIEKFLGDLAEATVPLLSGAKTKSTPPVFGARVGGFGPSATVLKLTDDHDKGGEPTVEDGDWKVLRKRLDGKGTYYVRGHLLNHNLGGPGNTWDNLTPLTQNANNRASDSMLKTFEKPIKDATKEGNAINFAVTVTYGRSHPLASKVAKYEKSGDPEVKMVGEIIKAEKFVPKSLHCKGSKIDDKGKIGSVVANVTVENVIQDRFEDYFLTGESKQIFKINGASAADLQKLYGIDKVTATAIASNGPYESFDEVMKAGRLTAMQWKAARETPRLRVVLDI